MSQNKSWWDSQTCNYYKKPGHTMSKCQALKAKNDKAQRYGQFKKGTDGRGEPCRLNLFYQTNQSTEVVDMTKDDSKVDVNIFTLESTIEVELLLTMNGATNRLLDSEFPIMSLHSNPSSNSTLRRISSRFE